MFGTYYTYSTTHLENDLFYLEDILRLRGLFSLSTGNSGYLLRVWKGFQLKSYRGITLKSVLHQAT